MSEILAHVWTARTGRVWQHAGTAAAVLLVAAAGSACSSSAPHADSTAPPAPSPSTSSSSSGWRAPYYGEAQQAVDTLTGLLASYAKTTMAKAATAHPEFDRFVVGKAKQEFDDAYADVRKRGVFYQGTPDQPRILVSTSRLDGQLPSVTLTNCPLISTSDPLVAYSIKTGSKLPVSAGDLTPYLQTAIVVQLGGRWAVTAFATDTSRTCSR